MKSNQRSLIVSEVLSAVRQTITSLLSWCTGYPLSLLIKRDPNLTVVFSRAGGMFTDNCKYFFVYAHELLNSGERVVLLSTGSVVNQINNAGGEAIYHPSLRSLYTLLRCGTVVTDLFISGYYPFIRNARRVQLYHGAPLKHIELDIHIKRLARLRLWQRALLNAQKIIIGRYPIYDMVIATSENFIRMAFKRCFNSRQFIAPGYPRNDILFGWPPAGRLSWRLARINVDLQVIERVKKAQGDGIVVCLYAPTFRRELVDPFAAVLDLSRLSLFATKQGILFILKLHPFMHGRYHINQYPNLLEYNSRGDIYPLMAISDVLITDYSSIYFDFLLLDRPIVFFSYDLERYLREDRAMYFDYEAVTPGKKCRNQNELEACLVALISNGLDDGHADRRAKIRNFAHEHVDNQSTRRLIQMHLHTN